jgi:DnaJ-class molecular chaperone
MKYLKLYKIFESIDIQDLKDIFLELQDEGMKISTGVVENNNFIHVQGDLILNIVVDDKDDNFIRDGDNLIYNITLPYWKLLTHIDHLYINHYKDNNDQITIRGPAECLLVEGGLASRFVIDDIYTPNQFVV